MSDRGRPHNLGQALFESLGAGLKAYGVGLEQERIRKSETQQQSFLNRLREESAGREQERLVLAQKGFDLREGAAGREQERLDLAQNIFGLSQERFGFEQEKFGIQQEIDPIEQAQIDASQALTAKRTRETELLGTSAGRSMFGTGTGQTILRELMGGFEQREFGRAIKRDDPLFFRTGFSGEREPIPFSEARELISTPEDTLRVLLQQARSITGEAPTLSELGKEPVFPVERPPVDGIPPSAIAQLTEGLKQLYGEEQWNSLTPEEKEAIIRDQFFNPR